MTPDVERIKKCVTNMPEKVFVGECWEWRDGAYVQTSEKVFWLYSQSGSELFHVHKGIA